MNHDAALISMEVAGINVKMTINIWISHEEA